MRHITSISVAAALLIAALFTSCSIDLAIGDNTPASVIMHVDSTATCSTELPMRQIIDIRTAPSRINGKAIDSSDGETGLECSLRLETVAEEVSEVSADPIATASWKVSGDIELPYSASEDDTVTLEWGWPEVRDFYPITRYRYGKPNISDMSRISLLQLNGRIADGTLKIESIDIGIDSREFSEEINSGSDDFQLLFEPSPNLKVTYKIGDISVGNFQDFLPNFQVPDSMKSISLQTKNTNDKDRPFNEVHVSINFDEEGNITFKGSIDGHNDIKPTKYLNYIGTDTVAFVKKIAEQTSNFFSSIVFTVHQSFATLYVDSIEFTFKDASSAEPSS